MDISVNKAPSITKIDPTEFDVTISAILIGLGAEKYIDLFKRKNIGQCTLAELSNEDLIQLGVDDTDIRTRLLDEVKNLPIYEESKQIYRSNMGPIEIIDILNDSSNHLHRIYLSIIANTLALKRTKKISDCLLYRDKYASNIALSTLNEITNILNSMDITLHTQLKELRQESTNTRKKKIIVGTVGSAVIAFLTVLFVRSLKQIG